jgi:hypothetical protein
MTDDIPDYKTKHEQIRTYSAVIAAVANILTLTLFTLVHFVF